MASQIATERAAQIWCQPSTSHIVMDVTLAEAFAKAIDEDMRELAMVDESLARRPRLDDCANRYSKVQRLCSMAGKMESACIRARNFLMSKARRDPQEQEIVRMLSDVTPA